MPTPRGRRPAGRRSASRGARSASPTGPGEWPTTARLPSAVSIGADAVDADLPEQAFHLGGRPAHSSTGSMSRVGDRPHRDQAREVLARLRHEVLHGRRRIRGGAVHGAARSFRAGHRACSTYVGSIFHQVGQSWSNSGPQSSTRLGTPFSPRTSAAFHDSPTSSHAPEPDGEVDVALPEHVEGRAVEVGKEVERRGEVQVLGEATDEPLDVVGAAHAHRRAEQLREAADQRERVERTDRGAGDDHVLWPAGVGVDRGHHLVGDGLLELVEQPAPVLRRACVRGHRPAGDAVARVDLDPARVDERPEVGDQVVPFDLLGVATGGREHQHRYAVVAPPREGDLGASSGPSTSSRWPSMSAHCALPHS